jgi:hypothetical protein
MRSAGTSVGMKRHGTPAGGTLAAWLVEDASCWMTVVATVALEAASVALLLPGAPLLGSPRAAAAAVFHVTAALLVAAGPIPQSSRRWLCAAVVLAVPYVGAAVATAVLCTRGRGPDAAKRSLEIHRRPALTVEAARRLGKMLSPPDALDLGDEEQRRSALLALIRRTDPEGVTLLRWAAYGRDRELALLAALALDEIRERSEAPASRVESPAPRVGAPAPRTQAPTPSAQARTPRALRAGVPEVRDVVA